MAKETKTEREARTAQEQATAWAEFVAAYPTRFAALMFAYMDTAGDFQVRKLDAETYEFTRHEHLYRNFQLKATPPENYNHSTVDAMETLEGALADYAREQAEAQRRYTVKLNALAKLSKEERELLGL